jgi:hypothetical protein
MPLPVQATAFAAVALVLLVPTFNALNNASFEESEPPFDLNPRDGSGPGFSADEDGEYDVDVIPDEDGWQIGAGAPRPRNATCGGTASTSVAASPWRAR